MRGAAVLLMMLVLAGGGVIAFVALHDGDREAVGRLRSKLPHPRVTPRELPRLACPATLAGCHSVRGYVVLVESVDPDGDGDLHVVVAGRGGVTAPGLSAIDIRRGLRPARDPRLGDSVAAVGPVGRGSYGQRQLAAVELRVLRR